MTTCVDAETVARRAASEIARHLESIRAERGVAHLALSGGSSPTRAYELLAAEPVDWSGVEVWFADERCVPPDNPESNYRLASETLLTPAGIGSERVHRMEGELDPEEAARRYTLALREDVGLRDGELPVLDLVVLGIGPDGHVASLFPGAPTLEAPQHELCLGVRDSPKPPPERVTLTLAVLRAAGRCLLLATGAGKADALSAMLAEPSHHVPASLLRRERLTVIADDAASPGPIDS
jgi:6-phosphogluconolactonase